MAASALDAACMMVFRLLGPSILMPAASPRFWPSDSPLQLSVGIDSFV